MEKLFILSLYVAFAIYIRRPFLVYSQPAFQDTEYFKSLVAFPYWVGSGCLRGLTPPCRFFGRDRRIHQRLLEKFSSNVRWRGRYRSTRTPVPQVLLLPASIINNISSHNTNSVSGDAVTK